MANAENNLITPEVMVQLQTAAENAFRQPRNVEEAVKASEEMDRIREEIRQEHGILDIGVSAIREIRDS